MKLGISGHLTQAFIRSPLTPLLLLAAVAVGLVALGSLPREEEPQISVPLVDIHVDANGLRAIDAVQLVTKPLEEIVKAIDGVEHVYSQTEDDKVIVTARFFVGTSSDDAILRVHEKIRANFNRIPVGIPEPLVVGRGINDVPILTLTIAPKPVAIKKGSDKAGSGKTGPGKDGAAVRWTDNGLYTVGEKLLQELVKVENVGLTFIAGGRANQIRVEPDTERLSLYGVSLNQLITKIREANRSFVVGAVRQDGKSVPVVAGQTLRGIPDIGLLLVTTKDGRPVYVKDVARVVVGAKPEEHRVWHLTKAESGKLDGRPAVTLAFAKRKGANAVTVAEELLERLEQLGGRLVPKDLEVTVTRNYGETANEKANELLFHLALATISIVVLIVLALGWREGVVVMVVIPTTILLTLFAAWLMGYTINRVSLFALIFSIGILVDDAIVVVENIARHWHRGAQDALKSAVEAVAEVGNPTIIATLTIIAALLPMMFVSGLMGPYMSPIPANASAAMLFSFFVAVVVTPWLLVKLRGRGQVAAAGGHAPEGENRLGRFYLRVATPLLAGRRRSKIFLLVVALATLASLVLFYTRDVTVKLLPFDNKSELAVVIDLPEGSTLEDTERVLMAAARRLAKLPELTSIQAYAGTPAPFNFNGLVRHYYLRQRPELGELQLNLAPKAERDRPSHEIALQVRRLLKNLELPKGTAVKVVEVPPGPPVLATLLAEVYGPDAKTRRRAAALIAEAFRSVDFIIDVDVTYGQPADRLRFSIDQDNLEFHGVEEKDVYDAIAALLGGVRLGYSHRGGGATPIEIAVRLPKKALTPRERLLSTPVPARSGVVELADVVQMRRERASFPIFRRDGRFAEMVLAELAGRFEAPIYGMLAVEEAIEAKTWPKGLKPTISYYGQPHDESYVTLLWDGEWEVTYVTFRDMGAAFAVAILAIYLLVVGQFRSFRIPLLILVPVPLTLVGIMLGHWIFGAPFTATSMIGFIAL
ncbi:MAG: efflux RND transporter permease subunit, partial [Alphaproteobacteria bacterium]|nr:efflux RND transporter permease subunit [Alphaproteobacteria bacterium]